MARTVVKNHTPKASSAYPYDTEGVRRVFEAYGPELHRFLMRRTGCAHTARDLAQDAYLRFMLVSRQETVRNPQAFLYQLAANLVYEFKMRELKTQVVYDSELLEAADHRNAVEAPPDPVDRLSSQEQLRELLNALPKAYRAVLLLRKRDGLSPDEIAQRLGFSKKTVYEYLTRALARIKERRLEER
jgi:RNA polymerase sigma-70 factor (ECF subfamily)